MRKLSTILIGLLVSAIWVVPMLVLGQDPTAAPTAAPTGPHEDLGAIIKDLPVLLELGKAGSWATLALIVINMLWGLVSWFKPLYSKLKEWGPIVNIALGAVSAGLAMVLGGASWQEALIVFIAGPFADLYRKVKKMIQHQKAKAKAEAKLAENELKKIE